MCYYSHREIYDIGKIIISRSLMKFAYKLKFKIPSNMISVFLRPYSLIDAIEKMLNAFWWRHVGSR